MLSQIIVYRSRFEQDRDEFFNDNPEYILYLIGIILCIAFGLYLCSAIPNMIRRIKRKKMVQDGIDKYDEFIESLKNNKQDPLL